MSPRRQYLSATVALLPYATLIFYHCDASAKWLRRHRHVPSRFPHSTTEDTPCQNSSTSAYPKGNFGRGQLLGRCWGTSPQPSLRSVGDDSTSHRSAPAPASRRPAHNLVTVSSRSLENCLSYDCPVLLTMGKNLQKRAAALLRTSRRRR